MTDKALHRIIMATMIMLNVAFLTGMGVLAFRFGQSPSFPVLVAFFVVDFGLVFWSIAVARRIRRVKVGTTTVHPQDQ